MVCAPVADDAFDVVEDEHESGPRIPFRLGSRILALTSVMILRTSISDEARSAAVSVRSYTTTSRESCRRRFKLSAASA
jgi:hypothetical protein